MADPSTSFYMIHGDNFYDKTGEITKAFYNQLTLEAQSKFLGVTAGNHDYWYVLCTLAIEDNQLFVQDLGRSGGSVVR
jgi:hypothetical protein